MPTAEPEGFAPYAASWHRKSPFYADAVAAGATTFEVYNHMLLPVGYASGVDEYRELVSGVTLWDVGAERQVEITGPDAFRFTNLLTCRDLTTCAVGQCKYAPIISAQGGIVNDPILLRLGDRRFWLSVADSDVLLWAKGVAVHAGMDVEIVEPDVSPVQIQGPKAKQVMASLFGDEILAMRYYRCAERDLDGIPVVVSRTGWSAETGYEIFLRDSSRGHDLWERILDAGKPLGLKVTAPNDVRRIEAGIFNYGYDMGIDDTPLEISGLERLVEPQEADYIGKHVLERQRREGVSRKLTGLRIPGGPIGTWSAEPLSALVGGERVGRVTALAYSPRLEANIGYVWLPIGLSAPGTVLEVELPDGLAQGVTASIPFIDPGKAVPAGRIRASAVGTWLCVPNTTLTRPSRYQPIAVFSDVASA